MTSEDIEKKLEEMLRLMPLSSREFHVRERINDLCQNIRIYLGFFEKSCPFNQEQRRLHVQTINLRLAIGDVGAALRNNNFMTSLWRTLKAWGLNARAASLLSFEKFRETILENEDEILKWEDKRIDDKNLMLEEVAEGLWKLIDRVRVSEAYNPIVSGSKTFHHILPELVPPIDREYTRPFFMFWSQYFQYEPHKVFTDIWKKSALIASMVNLRQYIGRTSWSTSITKIIDNAIVGYCKYHHIRKLQ